MGRIAYTLLLTADEVACLDFVRGRYDWCNVLLDCLNDNVVSMTESDAWQWVEDVLGEDSHFACAAPGFVNKLLDLMEKVE